MLSNLFGGYKPERAELEADATMPKPVERMYTPVNYRVTEALEAESNGGPAPISRPELRRDLDRRRRGSREEGVVASKVKSSFHPKPGPGRTLQTESRSLDQGAPPPTPLMNTSLQAVRRQAAHPTLTPKVYAPPPKVAVVTSVPSYWMPVSGSLGVSPCTSPAVAPPLTTWSGYKSPAPFAAPLSTSVPQVLITPQPPQPRATEKQEPHVERKKTPEASAPAVKTATWAEVISELRGEAGDGYFVCVIGGAETPGTGTVSLLSSLAQELHSRLPRSVVFVVGASQAVSEAFSAGTDAEPDRVWNITEGWLRDHGLASGDEKELLAQVGDVYVFVEGGEDAAWVAQKAAERGADLVPIKRSGGASAGLYNFPAEALQRPPFVGEACWALLADSSAPIAAASAAASAAVAGALAKRCREKQPAEGSPSQLTSASTALPVGKVSLGNPFETMTPSWTAASWASDRGGSTAPADAEKSEKKIFQTASAPLSFTPALWTSSGTAGSVRIPAAPFAAQWPGSFSPLPGVGVAQMSPAPPGSFAWTEPPRRILPSATSFTVVPQLSASVGRVAQGGGVACGQAMHSSSFAVPGEVLLRSQPWRAPTQWKPQVHAFQWHAPAVEPPRSRGLFRSSSEILIGTLGDSDERAHCQKPRASSPLTTRSHAKYFASDQ